MIKDYIESIKKDIRKYSAIEAVKDSDGGRELITTLQKDISSVIEDIAGNYKTLSHIELVTKCARLSEKLSMLKVLERAKKNRELALDALKTAQREDTD